MAIPTGTKGMNADEAATYIRSVLDISIRVAEVLFANGAGAADTVAAMQGVTRAYGLGNIEADVTYSVISLSWENPSTYETITRSRNVKYRTLDYSRLTRATELIGHMIEHPPGIADARRGVAAIVGARSAFPRWLRSIGWSLVGVGAAFLLGGGLLVAVASFFATLVIDIITSWLNSRRVPVFYQTFVGGAIGPLVAALVFAIEPGVNPSLVVVATIIMLLAGVTTFGAVQDTLAGFYVTGTARLVEAVLITAGLVAGVLGTTLLLARFGIVLEISATMQPTVEGLPMQSFAAAVIVIGFALATQVPLRAFWAVAALGIVAEVLYAFALGAEVGIVFASAGAAVAVGLLAALAVRLVRVPPLVAVVSGLIPLVPGLALFQGLLQVADSNISGLLTLISAAGVAAALAAGAILGQYLVQAALGTRRALPRRFAGPLLALPVRLVRRPRNPA